MVRRSDVPRRVVLRFISSSTVSAISNRPRADAWTSDSNGGALCYGVTASPES